MGWFRLPVLEIIDYNEMDLPKTEVIMTIHDFSYVPAVEDLRDLNLLSVLSADEEFASEEALVCEVLARASASSLLACQEGKLSYDEFCDLCVQMKKFCIDHGYDFEEYCYGMEAAVPMQRGTYL